MLTLEQFVAETLKQISEAVANHEERTGTSLLPDKGQGDITPMGKTLLQQGFISFGQKDGKRIYATTVDFDVAITTDETAKAGAGAKLKVAGFFEAGADGTVKDSSSTVSRVRFKLPLSFS